MQFSTMLISDWFAKNEYVCTHMLKAICYYHIEKSFDGISIIKDISTSFEKGKTNLNIVLLKYTYSLILYQKQIHLHRLWCHQWVLMKPLPNWLGKLRLLFNYRFDYCDKVGPTPCCILTKTSSGDFLLRSASQFVILEQRQTTKYDLRLRITLCKAYLLLNCFDIQS